MPRGKRSDDRRHPQRGPGAQGEGRQGTPRAHPGVLRREVRGRGLMAHVSITVNGKVRKGDVEPRLLLVHFLREQLLLTGVHVGCDTSQCGACTVLVDGRSAKSCTIFAVQTDGSEVVTIEGLAKDGELHRLQKGFWEEHGLQCGYCTPGMIMSAVNLLNDTPT